MVIPLLANQDLTPMVNKGKSLEVNIYLLFQIFFLTCSLR